MTTVVFKAEYRQGAKHYKRGQLVPLPDDEALHLAQLGVVEIRRPHEPAETKGETC